MLTFKPLDVYDVVDPEQSLVEALREYPELVEFDVDSIEDGADDLEAERLWADDEVAQDNLAKQENPAIGEIHQLGKVVNLEILEAGRREKLAKQDNPALREALSDYPKPKASKKTKKPKASKAKPREESPKGIWGKLDLL